MPESFRADHVGSLLRPPEVHEARGQLSGLGGTSSSIHCSWHPRPASSASSIRFTCPTYPARGSQLLLNSKTNWPERCSLTYNYFHFEEAMLVWSHLWRIGGHHG